MNRHNLRLAWFIARRYLAPQGQGRLLSFITWIALGGVTVGVTALIAVIGVMTGMQEDLQDKILGSSPHIIVLQRGSSLRMDDWRSVRDSVLTVDGVEAAAPFLLTEVALMREEYAQPADLYGIPMGEDLPPVTEMEEEIRTGVHSLQATESGLTPLLVGSRLADRMQVFQGDTLVLISLENIRTNPLGGLDPAMRQFEVTGTFTTGMYDYDVRNIYAPLPAVQDLLDLEEGDRVSGIGVRTVDPWQVDEIESRLREALRFPYYVQSWTTTNSSLFAALTLEKLALGVILFLIVVVAAFNIVSTLVMVVVNRTREIGILKSMGMKDKTVLQIFKQQGLAIGVVGTVLGTGLGLLLVWLLDTYEFIELPGDVYFVDTLPVALDPVDLALIFVLSVLVAFAATIYPARQASRMVPVEAIRHE
ncbi:MAG: FtsX-like permease family protein [Longimicrobiales bacterium]